MKVVLQLLEYAAFLLVELLIRCLPAQAMVQISEGLGALWFRIDRRRRHRAGESVAVAVRGGLTVEDPAHLVRRTFPNLIRVPLEGVHFGRFFRTDLAMLRRCRFFGDWQAFRRDLHAGRGGVFTSGHHGNWEVLGFGLRYLKVPARVVVRPIENPWIDARATGTRSSDPDRAVIAKRGAVREMLRTLKQRRWVGVMADQNAGPRGTWVDFFGLPASSYAAPAVLAVRMHVPMYAAACIRLPGAPMRFEMHLLRLPDPPPELEEKEAALFLLRAFVERLEGWVQRAPEQYNWIHRRWKSRPPGEVPGPEHPAYAEFAPSS